MRGLRSLSYCGELLRSVDADRFLLSMFAPADRREALWALFAFHYEVAKTREVVSETMLGQIRLQWWRDALAGIYDGGEIPEHEVVQPLAAAIAEYDLPRAEFEALIHAREFDLEDVLPTHLEGLLIYLEHTNVPLLNLALRVLGVDPATELVQSVAINYALVGILRAVPYHARQRRCYLPSDLLEKHGVRVSQIYEMKPENGIVEVVREIAAAFTDGLQVECKFLRKGNVLAGLYMKQIERCGDDPFSPVLARPPTFKALRILFG